MTLCGLYESVVPYAPVKVTVCNVLPIVSSTNVTVAFSWFGE